MRNVVYGAACSLDGFIAGPKGEIDWLHFSKDVQHYMAGFWPTVDTILMGRKTYEFASSAGGGGGGSMSGITATYVFSRTLPSVKGKGAHLVRDDAGEFVRHLKAEDGKGICVLGGGELASSLLDADVIDQVGMNMHPVLLGAGVPLFAGVKRRVPLVLQENRTLDGGCVLATYRVQHR
jgi:dihydrofolate reductase